MTEREKRQRRMEFERRRTQRQGGHRVDEGASGNLFIFRTYVTFILVGGFLLVSAFSTDTSEKVSQRLKETIAYQLPMDEIVHAKDKMVTFLKEQNLSMPVFLEEQGEAVSEQEKSYKPDLEEAP
ncbi:MAG: hypothetical protein ACK5I7_07080 [Anaerotignum sp.]